ncbi:MAG: DUF2079 domain-containing protein [Candidatus Omnitrophica bacterium]|nr:DUF2079 domain-containing protein [Candidatus Omnitrophota bacterium]
MFLTPEDKYTSSFFAVCISLIVFFIFGTLLTVKYYSFGYYDWDLAFFSQASWNLIHGRPFVSLVGINFFGDHSYFFMAFFLPFFGIFHSPLVLIYAKLLAFIIAGYLFFLYAEKRLGGRIGILFLIMYFLFPPNIFGLLYEFNPEAFAPPVIFLMFLALDNRKFKELFFWSIVLMTIKENMALVAFMFSLWALVIADKKDKLFLGVFAVFCLAVFIYLTAFWVPSLRGLGHHAFTVRYPQLGSNALEVALSPFLKPREVFGALTTAQNGFYLFEIFGIFSGLAILTPWPVFLMAPLLLQHCLSSHFPEHTIFYHYGPTMAPFVFIAAVHTLFRISRFNKGKFLKNVLLAVLLGGTFVSAFSYRADFFLRLNIHNEVDIPAEWAMIKSIPQDASVVATFKYLAPLSVRDNLYSFHMVYDRAFQDLSGMRRSELNVGKAFSLPVNVEYALIDWNDSWLLGALLNDKDKVLERINAFLKKSPWRVVRQENKSILLRRDIH